MRVNTIQTVEFGNSPSSLQVTNEAREAAFELALSEAERADSLRSDESRAAAETDAIRGRDDGDRAEKSDESDPDAEKDPDDEAHDKDRDRDKDESDARRYQTGQLLDINTDVAALPTGPIADRAAAAQSQSDGSKKDTRGATVSVARSERTFATQPLASSPVASLGSEVAATTTATAAPTAGAGTAAVSAEAVRGPVAVEATGATGDDGRTGTTADGKDSVRGKPITAQTSSARFIDPRTLHAIEAARESVFRQIAMRITPEGGEMRVRLDPPELGEVDVQMIVEKGSTMRMVVVAERPEMADLLERHLDELKQTLEQQGITVSDASIHARDDRSDHRNLFGGGTDRATDDSGEDITDRTAAKRGGYITSEGLDFWV